jgi:uncharacterized membrane protein (DUF106 family)
MVFIDPQLEISIAAAALAVFSQAVQFRFGNKKEMVKHQAELKKHQSRLKELSKNPNASSKKEMEEVEKKMMDSLSVVMKSTNKLLIASMVIFLPAFFVLSAIYGEFTFNLPVPIPWLAPEPGFELFNPLTWFSLYNQTNFVGWYALSSLVFSLLIVNPLIKMWEKRGAKNAESK